MFVLNDHGVAWVDGHLKGVVGINDGLSLHGLVVNALILAAFVTLLAVPSLLVDLIVLDVLLQDLVACCFGAIQGLLHETHVLRVAVLRELVHDLHVVVGSSVLVLRVSSDGSVELSIFRISYLLDGVVIRLHVLGTDLGEGHLTVGASIIIEHVHVLHLGFFDQL